MGESEEWARLTLRTCLFCQSGKLTREHIWPDWIVKLFPSGPRWRGGIDDSTGRRIRMTSTSLTHKAKCVCSTCNSGWMSDIEIASTRVLKPLIEGSRKRRVLTRKEQRRLAQWMTLRSMVLETQYPERNRYYTQSEREAFARNRSLDAVSNLHIWLADFPDAPAGAAVNMEPIANLAKDAGRQRHLSRRPGSASACGVETVRNDDDSS